MASSDDDDEDLKTPRPEWWGPIRAISALGLLPFIAALYLTIVPSPELIDPLIFERAVIGYGVLVLAFLGGVRWGARLQAGSAGAFSYLAGILGSVLGLVTLLLPVSIALVLLVIGFAAQGLWDVWSGHRRRLPIDYARIRVPMTFAACFMLIAILAARVL